VLLDATSNNVLEGNYIGTDVTGSVGISNVSFGVLLFDAAFTQIGGTTPGAGNVISDSAGVGIEIAGGTSTNITIQGNLIGTDATGTKALGNSGEGILLVGGGGNNTTLTLIGGTDPGARNVISANGIGIEIGGSTATANQIQGNYIGTDITGSKALGNLSDGVLLSLGANNNTIGGTAAGAGNLISGNSGDGISITDAGTSSNVVEGNFIGTDAAGSVALGNLGNGVTVEIGASNNTIGGTTAGARNIISGNAANGIHLLDGYIAFGNEITRNTANNAFEGNYIGTDVTGNAALGNGNDGIFFDLVEVGETIGGSAPGAGNLISANHGFGIEISGNSNGQNFPIEGNFIGTNQAGTAALGNGGGIHLLAANITIGGATPGAGNLISGNGSGIFAQVANYCAFQGNLIGTDITGTRSLGPQAFGIDLFETGVDLIGGTSPGDRNIIAGNSVYQVLIQQGDQTGLGDSNLVEGNYIRVDATGEAALGGTGPGVLLTNGTRYNTIGGTAAGAGNVISGNGGAGVQLENGIGVGLLTTGNLVEGNLIGTDATGTVALGNQGAGVLIDQGAANNTIGGTTAGAGNVISGNGLPPGIVSWYRADGNANDSVSGNNGALIGGVSFGPGVSGQAFNLDGVSGYVQIPSAPAFNPAALTLEAWIKPTSIGPTFYQEIISKYDSSSPAQGHSWDLEITPTGQLEMGVEGTPTASPDQFRYVVSNPGVITAGVWQHVAGTFDPITQNITLYVNGVSVPVTLGADL
jgi:titin